MTRAYPCIDRPLRLASHQYVAALGRREETTNVSIEAGAAAPKLDLTVEDATGERHDLGALTGPVLYGLYKSSCQASKSMFPILERLHERYGKDGLTVLGVAQDSPNVTRSFARRYGITFPILIEGEEYPISRAFDIAATPTVYLVKPDGTVAYTTMGFFKGMLDQLGDAVAAAVGRDPEPLITEADSDIPLFVPG
jgi:peroxiredoxin